MSTCLFCTNIEVSKIHETSVKDAMLLFFGHQIQDYLKDKDTICDICLNGLEVLAHIKKELLPHIYREDPCIEQRKPKVTGTQWEYIATLNPDDIPWRTRSSTPNGLNGLVACKRIEPYVPQKEKKYECIQHDRSLSRSSYNSHSDIDNEIETIFNKKRKRRKGNHWTRTKKSVYSDSNSPASTIRTRSQRSRTVSVISTESVETVPFHSNLKYVNGCLINKRTRSVSRQQEEQARLIFNNKQLYQCTNLDCDFLCESVDVISEHKQKLHRMMALFWCDECGNRYTTREELKTHENDEHIVNFCAICHQEFPTNQAYKEHWQIHVNNSTICRYCKLRYLKNIINKHQKECRIAKKTEIILNNNNVREQNQADFQIKVLIQDAINEVS